MKSFGHVVALGVFFTSIYAWASKNEDDLWLISDDEPKAQEKIAAQPEKGLQNVTTSRASQVLPRQTSRVSSQAMTLGVETEEHAPIQWVGSIRSGAQGFLGNETLSTKVATPSLMVDVGAQISTSFQMYLSLQKHNSDLGAPLVYTTSGNQVLLNTNGSVFRLSQTQLFLGGRMYFRNRDAVVRPYFGGNLGLSRGSIQFKSEWDDIKLISQAKDLDFHQLLAGGELGLEVSLTRSIALSLSGKIQGVLSTLSNLSVDVANAGVASQTTAGNALSKTAVLGLSGGLSFYF